MEDIRRIIQEFRTKRKWDLYDRPANMAKSIIIEASELLENYQWSDEAKDLTNVKEELADILIYTITLCDIYGFDIKEIIKEKLKKNAIKYPEIK
ncbi:MAG TPA: MazG-like family protein [Bacilli bacterium]|nr:MazG-like family protein [Bacilli bacterium]